MKQLNRNQAIALYESGEWEDWSDEEVVKIQLFQDRLCIPFDRFHKAIEQVLGRSIWTHEFANVQLLRDEYLGKRSKPKFEDIIDLIPKDKLIIFLEQ